MVSSIQCGIQYGLRLSLMAFGVIFSASAAAYEKVFSVGYQNHDATWQTENADFDNQDFSDASYHFGFRFYNAVGEKHLFGVGIDYDEVLSQTIVGYRALEYQYRLNSKLHMGAFFGAASIDTGLPQNGYYFGLNASFFVVPDKLAVQYEYKSGDGLARDRVSSDPQDTNLEDGIRPDIFLDYSAHVLALRWHF